MVTPYEPATGTSATSATPAVPGPDAAGLNPAASNAQVTTSLNPAIANKKLPGGGNVGGTAAQPARSYNDEQIVQELAKALNVKNKSGQSLDTAVVDALAKKYGVRIPTTTAGTGTGQGAIGSMRHNIASWFSTAATTTNQAFSPGDVEQKKSYEDAVKEAQAIKNPQLRQQALAKAEKLNPINNDRGGEAGTPVPVPDQSKKALVEMLQGVTEKLGINRNIEGESTLAQVAAGMGEPIGSQATAATPGSPQTAGQAYQQFIKNLADTATYTSGPNKGKTFAQVQVAALEAAGLLDLNSAGTNQANGTRFTTQQISQAYQTVITQQVNNNQTEQQALSALASDTQTPGAPTSEMYAYVQGVATEFGVGLTNQQITQIANTYGANATVADQPASVEDEIKDAVVSLYDPSNPNNPPGVASTMFTDIQQSANEYQIPVNASQIGNMVQHALQGATVESVYVAADAAMNAARETFQKQAAGLYPALASQIEQGNTVQNLVAPYFNVAEAYTGVPASTMMADQASGGPSKWAAFLQGGQNPTGSTQQNNATGKVQAGPQMMTLDEWKKTLMQNPIYGFQNTQGGKDMAEQLTAAILNEFGKASTTTSANPVGSLYQGQSDLSANVT